MVGQHLRCGNCIEERDQRQQAAHDSGGASEAKQAYRERLAVRQTEASEPEMAERHGARRLARLLRLQ